MRHFWQSPGVLTALPGSPGLGGGAGGRQRQESSGRRAQRSNSKGPACFGQGCPSLGPHSTCPSTKSFSSEPRPAPPLLLSNASPSSLPLQAYRPAVTPPVTVPPPRAPRAGPSLPICRPFPHLFPLLGGGAPSFLRSHPPQTRSSRVFVDVTQDSRPRSAHKTPGPVAGAAGGHAAPGSRWPGSGSARCRREGAPGTGEAWGPWGLRS